MICLWLVHDSFMTCLQIFTILSQLVHDFFTIGSELNLFTSCSWLVHSIFTFFHNFFITCSRLVCSFSQFSHKLFMTDLYMTCSWVVTCVQNLFISYSFFLIHDLFTIWSKSVHQFVHHFFMCCSLLVYVFLITCS